MDSALFSTLEQWIKLACPSIQNVVEAKQRRATAPRSEQPYAAIRFVTDIPQAGTSYDCPTTEDGTEEGKKLQYHSWPRQMSLQVDIYGDNAKVLGERLEISPSFPQVIELFKAAELSVIYVGGLGDTSALRGTSWEPSVQLDFWVTRIQEATQEVDWIETAEYDITHKTVEAP